MIAQLLEKDPNADLQATVDSDPVMAAVIGGTDVQHAIVAGAGARAVDSNGNPWQGSYITASGNLLADFTANANGEMQGRLQAARLYHMTDDKGVRDLLSFLIARDTMHQNQWIAAAAELRAEGLEQLPVPSNFPQSHENQEVHYQYLNFSDGAHAKDGTWASGPTPDGNGEFTYHDGPTTFAPMPPPTVPDPRLYGTDPNPNLVDKLTAKVKDVTGH
jgi:Mn-containing catalase